MCGKVGVGVCAINDKKKKLINPVEHQLTPEHQSCVFNQALV